MSTAAAISKEEEMSRAFSPPIERVIHSFNAELDQLTKSFDDLLSQQQENKTTPHYYSTAKKETVRIQDPPLFSPLRNYVNDSTPARRKQTPYAKTPSYTYTPAAAEPPPAPVETPLIPNPTTTTRKTTSSIPRHSEPFVVEPQNLYYNNNHSNNNNNHDWEEALNQMRQTLSDQETAIRNLERENEMLRQQLLLRGQTTTTTTTTTPSDYPTRETTKNHPTTTRMSSSPYHHRSQAYHREDFSAYQQEHTTNAHQEEERGRGEPNGRQPPASTSSTTYRTTPMSTPVRIRSPPRRIHTTAASLSQQRMMRLPEEGFTPGTRFVADLSRLMKMEKGHHAPLSMILDKHWGQLKHHLEEDADDGLIYE